MNSLRFLFAFLFLVLSNGLFAQQLIYEQIYKHEPFQIPGWPIRQFTSAVYLGIPITHKDRIILPMQRDNQVGTVYQFRQGGGVEAWFRMQLLALDTFGRIGYITPLRLISGNAYSIDDSLYILSGHFEQSPFPYYGDSRFRVINTLIDNAGKEYTKGWMFAPGICNYSYATSHDNFLHFCLGGRNGIRGLNVLRYNARGTLAASDTAFIVNLRQDQNPRVGHVERVELNRLNVTTTSFSQAFLSVTDTLGYPVSSRLLFTNPSLKQLSSARLLKNPNGGYNLIVELDTTVRLPGAPSIPFRACYVVRFDSRFQELWRTKVVGANAQMDTDGGLFFSFFRSPAVPGITIFDTTSKLAVQRLDHLGNTTLVREFQGNKNFVRRIIQHTILDPSGDGYIFGTTDSLPSTSSLMTVGKYLYMARISNMGKPYQPYIPGVGPNSVADALPPVPIAVFPNPAHDVAYLQDLTDKPEPFTLLNQLGQAVRTGTVSNSQNSLTLQGLPTGLYVLALRDKRLRLVVE